MLINEVGNLKFRNCIIALSGSPLSKNNEYAIKASIKAGIGAITTKTISSEGGHGFGRNSMKELSEYGLPDSFLVTGEWCTEVVNLTVGTKIVSLMNRCRGKMKSLKIIVSVLERTTDPDKWASTAVYIENTTKCDAIELNLGKWLPKHYRKLEMNLEGNVDEKFYGAQKLQEECYKKHIEIAREVTQRVSLPVLVKLGHGARYNDYIAEALTKEGIPIVSLNAPKATTLSSLFSPFKPVHDGLRGFKQGVITGAVLFEPHLTFNVALLKKTAYRAQIVHSGGIITYEQAIQALIKGVQLVGICSVLFLKGVNIIKDLDYAISKFSRDLGVCHVKDLQDSFKGQRILDEFEEFRPASIKLDPDLCTGCLKCLEVCPGNYITKDGKTVRFKKYCQGCGACIRVCPKGAIRVTYE